MENVEINQEIITPEYTTQFLAEADELLDKIEQNLLDIKGDTVPKELSESLSRYFQDLKGKAGLLEYFDIVVMCYEAESFLNKLSSEITRENSDQISLLLQIVDFLRKEIFNLEEGQPQLIFMDETIRFIDLVEKAFKIDKQNANAYEVYVLDKTKSEKQQKNSGNIETSRAPANFSYQNSNKDESMKNDDKNGTRQFIRTDLNETTRLLDLIEAVMNTNSIVSQHMFLEETDRLYSIICYSGGYKNN